MKRHKILAACGWCQFREGLKIRMEKACNEENFLVKDTVFSFWALLYSSGRNHKICNYLVYSIYLNKLEATEQLPFTVNNSLPSEIFVTTSVCVDRTVLASVDGHINQVHVGTWPTAATCVTRFSTEVGDIRHVSQIVRKDVEELCKVLYPIVLQVILFLQKRRVSLFREKRRRCQ